MTVSTITRKVSYSASGSTATFSYTFKIFADSDLKVYKNNVLQTLGSGADYTVTGAGNSGGGTVVFNSNPAENDAIVILRELPRTQATDFVENESLPASSLEDAFDRAVMIDQEIDDKAGVGFRFADTVTDAGTITIDKNATDRANKLLAFDSSGGLSATQEIGTYKGNWAAGVSYAIRDIVKATGVGNNIYICKTAHTSSGANLTASDSAKWDLLVDAASATTSQTAAASSASAAATSATAAATSATSSASSATSSASSATSSASSATSSASSATSSASSATASAASASEASTHASNAAANSGPYYSATTGTDTYVATPNPALATYEEGVDIILKFGTGNTGATTLNVSGLGAKDLKKADGSAFSSGELTSGQIQHFVYNGTEFRLMGTVASVEDLIKINTLDIFQNTINDMADHSDNLLETVDGFTDNFQDGSTQSNTAFDLTGSSSVTHDNTNKLWSNTNGATNQNSDKDYTTEGNYLQQTWDASVIGANATFTNGSPTVTTTGTWPTGIDGGRISQDGTNFYNIDSRDSATQITIASNFAQATATSDFTLYLTKFDSGVVKLSEASSSSDVTDIDLGAVGNFTTNGNAGASYNTEWYVQQSFTPTQTGTLKGFSFIWEPYGNHHPSAVWIFTESGDLAVSGGRLAESDTRNTSTLTSGAYNEYVFSGANQITLTGGTKYVARWVLLSGHNGTYTQSLQRIKRSNTTSYHSGGRASHSNAKDNLNSTGQFGAWSSNADFGFKLKLEVTSAINPTLYTSVIDTYAQSTDVSLWADINSSAITETLNSQNAYYWVIFSAASGYGANTEVSIFNQTGSVWRTIAKNSAGTWQYNNNASHDATQTLVNSTVNDMLHAVSQAISTQAANRMTGTEAAAISDAEWEATNGFATSDTLLTRGLTLYSASSSQNPEVSQFRVNYDSDKLDGTFLTRAFGGTNMPPVPSSNINTMVALIIDKRTTGTPTYEASSNGGTTWTEFSTWVHEDLMSNGYTKRMAEIDVSAHSGARTSPLIRIKNGSTGEDYDLKAIGIKYK